MSILDELCIDAHGQMYFVYGDLVFFVDTAYKAFNALNVSRESFLDYFTNTPGEHLYKIERGREIL